MKKRSLREVFAIHEHSRTGAIEEDIRNKINSDATFILHYHKRMFCNVRHTFSDREL